MKFRSVQPNFSKGELAPDLRGRFDADAYQAALQRARNVLILKYGGITKRPGTRFVAEIISKDDDNRLVPFEFSISQTYALEMGQGYMAPCALGGRVLQTEVVITSVTAALNAQVTAVFHGYSAGDKVWIDGLDGELGELLNGRCFPVESVVDADNFTIGVDTTGLTFSGSSGGETRVAAPDPDPVPPTVPSPVEDPVEPETGGGGGDEPDPRPFDPQAEVP